jgi:hypothetical protein
MDLQARLIFHAPMMKPIACVMLGAVLFACGNKAAQPEATSPTTSSPVASAPVASAPTASASASASTTPAPVASASAASSSTAPAPGADPGVVIQIKGNLILVDGSPADALGSSLDDLSTKLKSTRDLWTKAHAGQPFPGRVMLKVEKATPAAGVRHIIDVARAAGYPNAAIANP